MPHILIKKSGNYVTFLQKAVSITAFHVFNFDIDLYKTFVITVDVNKGREKFV